MKLSLLGNLNLLLFMQNKFSKILIICFLFIFIFQLGSLVFLLTAPSQSNAGEIEFNPQISIPGMENMQEFQKVEGKTGVYKIDGASIGAYIKAIYKYAIGVVGILATVVLMWGGLVWLTAGGSAERVTEAKSWITASLTGLVLALCSFMILATINPDLTTFQPIVVKDVEAQGCCILPQGGEMPGMTLQDCKNDGGDWLPKACPGRRCVIDYGGIKYTGEIIPIGQIHPDEYKSFWHALYDGHAELYFFDNVIANPIITNSTCGSFCNTLNGSDTRFEATQTVNGKKVACCVCDRKNRDKCTEQNECSSPNQYCAVGNSPKECLDKKPVGRNCYRDYECISDDCSSNLFNQLGGHQLGDCE